MNNVVLNMYKDNKKRFGKKVKVTRTDFSTLNTIAIIKEYNNGNNSTDDKRILFDVKDNIAQGDIIQFENNTYLILLQEETINNIYTKYVARRCDNKIKVKFCDGIYNMDCAIEDKIQNTSDGKIMSLIDGKIEILTQLNNISKKIRYNWNFICMGNKWQVEGFSYCNKGLYKIYATKTEYNKDVDDMENGISNNPEGKDIYMNDNYILEVKIDNNSLKVGETKQLNIVAKKNGVIDDKAAVVYKSNNTDVVEVSNTGLITAIGEGVTTISILYNNVVKVITININKIVYNLEVITTDSKLKTNETLQIQTKCTIDGIEDLNPHKEYSSSDTNIVEVNEIGLITAKNEGNAIITVKYKDIEKYINIEVKNAEEPPKIEVISEDGEFNVDITIDKTFSAKYFSNGIEDKTAKFTFVLENKVKYDNRHRLLPQLATIKSYNNNSCVISANKKAQYGYIVLTVSLSDNSLKIEKEIMVKNPFA